MRRQREAVDDDDGSRATSSVLVYIHHECKFLLVYIMRLGNKVGI